ncbi:hypothetical protein K7640_12390 [Micromonospora sp. PLK6-60]|uniref:nSTAND1 domain-containing NTPase n=1 Tax=Micromonospora sp. PLK6-60 TaxID=2873383 RepID=UPI001CA7240F|nr:hypothetical protein [Micromonospora sp. PLK6-60]MBY8872634.1 hypothetical protein [Micromonospora sp. PLK6-60]
MDPGPGDGQLTSRADPPPDQPSAADREVRLEAHASGSGVIYQAGRDQHLHFGPGGVRRAEGGPVADECPFPGMEAFDVDQAAWFFGRDRVTHRLVDRLDERRRAGGALAVVAASGAGKSSLLRAGLLPALARGALPGSRHWRHLVLTPTADPVGELTSQLAELTGAGPAQVAGAMASGPAAVVDVVRAAVPADAAPHPGPRLLVVVDQVEELFTLGGDAAARRGFLEVLAALAEPGAGGEPPLALVVHGIRADFYAAAMAEPRLSAALQEGQVILGPMTTAELREAILNPASRAGLEVEPGLTELLLRDLGALGAGDGDEPETGYDAGRLPLLAHALRACWQERHGNVLTVAGYLTTGGIRDAVARTAEGVYDRLDPDARQVARTMFLRLVRISEDTEDTRRRLPRTDLVERAADPATAEAVMAAFTERRLLTQGRETVEITHEALIQHWPRLRRWISEERADDLTRQRLEEAAAGWDRDGRDAGALYRGTRLETARAWAAGGDRQLSPVAAAFLDESDRRERSALLRGRRVARFRRRALAAMTVLAVLASVGVVVAGAQYRSASRGRAQAQEARLRAEEQRRLAVVRAAVGESAGERESDPRDALRVGLAALTVSPSAQSRGGLLETLRQTRLDGAGPEPSPLGKVGGAAFSPDRRWLAVQADASAGPVTLWEATDLARPRKVADLSVGGRASNVAFSPDSRALAVATDKGPVWFGRVAGPDGHPALAQLPGSRNSSGVAFAPDGRTLATTVDRGDADDLILWDVHDPARPRRLSVRPADESSDEAWFSPDGRLLATASGLVKWRRKPLTSENLIQDSGVTLWDVSQPTRPRRLSKFRYFGGDFRFHPSGRLIAANDYRRVALWDVSTPARPRLAGRVDQSSSNIGRLAFSPDGRHFATGLDNDQTVLWDVADPARPVRVTAVGGRRAEISAVVFSRDGRTFTTLDQQGRLARWSVQPPRQPAVRYRSEQTSVEAAGFGPDGGTLVVANLGADVTLWDLTDRFAPARPVRLPGSASGGVGRGSLAVSPDGATIATLGPDEQVLLWDVRDRRRPRRTATVPAGGSVQFLALRERAGRRLLFVGDNRLTVWDVTAPIPVRMVAAAYAGGDANAVSPGGDLALLPDGQVWPVPAATDHGDAAEPVLPDGTRDPARGLGGAFDRSGRTLAAAGWPDDNGTVVGLWDTAQGSGPGRLASIRVASDRITGLDWHPNSALLAGADTDGRVVLWDVRDRGEPVTVAELREHTGRTFVRLSPDGRTMATWSRSAFLLWDLGDLPQISADPVGRACRILGGAGLDEREWAERLPGIPYRRSCP